jgi:type IV secretory pathway VirB10-like protein
MATPNQDSLLAASTVRGRYKISKNLIWVVCGILVAAVVIVMTLQAMTGTGPAPAPTLTPQADISQAPMPEVIDSMARGQKEAAKKAQEEAETAAAKERAAPNRPEGKMPYPLTGNGGESFPEVDRNGKVVLPVPAAMNRGQLEGDPRIEEAARETLIRQGPILAISEGMGDALASNAKQPSGSGQPNVGAAQPEAQGNGLDQAGGLLKNIPNLIGNTPAPNKAKNERDWMKENAQLERDRVPLRGYTPTSRFVLMQGKVINAVLLTAVNTDLPGEIQAKVLMDVYDSIVGDTLLIPKGATLIGSYNSDVAVGQERVNMGFKRMILPNGVSVDLVGNIGMDGAGRAGIEGDVNNHYPKMFLISTLTAIGAYATTANAVAAAGVTINTQNIPAATAAQIFSDINKAVIDRNKNIAPTITIPAGIRFAVNVARDIELPAYKRQ